jgi:hypothetical protein
LLENDITSNYVRFLETQIKIKDAQINELLNVVNLSKPNHNKKYLYVSYVKRRSPALVSAKCDININQ